MIATVKQISYNYIFLLLTYISNKYTKYTDYNIQNAKIEITYINGTTELSLSQGSRRNRHVFRTENGTFTW